MPELPEVETIRRGLIPKVLHKTISKVIVKKPKLIRNQSIVSFQQKLTNNQFIGIKRIGKLLEFELKRQGWLCVHLKMTGQLIWQKKDKITAGGHPFPKLNQLPNKYSHIIIRFKDGSQLFFNDQRQFGYMQIVNNQQKDKIEAKFGIEPLTPAFNWKKWQKIWLGRTTAVKNILLNQKLISGIGNIYADEICFAAHIRPQTKANKLTIDQKKSLFTATKKIIKRAIAKGGTTFRDYRNASGKKGNFRQFLKVYQREGKTCLICKQAKIKKIKINGRGSRYCPACQT